MRRLAGFAALGAECGVALVVGALFAMVRALPPGFASWLGGATLRRLGPLLPAQRRARANLRLALPELGAAEHARILRESWDNLGRMACEYVHIDRIARFDPAHPTASRLIVPPAALEAFVAMRDDGKPALVFAAHLANWELPAVIAAQQGMRAAALYRTPNNRFVARRILRLRQALMGELIPAGPAAPFRMFAALNQGAHVGMLMDQRFGRGPMVDFFGHPAATNPVFAKLARHAECPVYGVRTVREGGLRFRMEVVGPLALPRDAAGRIDETAATAMVTGIIETWVRAAPGQWLWMHRRWRT